MSTEKNKELDEKIEAMSKELLISRKNGFQEVTDDEVAKADAFCEGYKAFLDASKTEREAVEFAIAQAQKKGFVEFEQGKTYHSGDKVYYNNRGKALILAVIGEDGCKDGVRLAAAHVDSPRLDLKPYPLYEANDMVLFKTHYYGGIKKYQWTAIPLAMHGRIVRRDGTYVDIRLGEEPGEPQFCVTDLLPHLGSEQMAKTLGKAIEGENLNVLIGSRPVRADKGSDLFKLNIMKCIHDKYNIVEEDFVSGEIEFVPAFKASDVGFDASMIGGYGHDDRVCAYTAIEAMLSSGTPKNTSMTILADKEEVGSEGNTGMNSAFLRYFISGLAKMEGLDPHVVMSKSKCLSADVTAAFDPTYASAYEPLNSCYLNNGVGVMKYTGSRGKAGTSDASAEFMSEVRRLLDGNDILWQTGELGKVDGGGGGTVAMYIANLNIDVVDMGVPVISMHSPFEIVAKLDVYMAYRAFKAFFEN